MAITIDNITTITSDNSDVDEATGVFDRFMLAARAQLEDAVENNEITQEVAGTALSQSIVGVLSQSIQFELQRERSDWLANAARSDADKRYVEMLANIDKVMGYGYELDEDGYILRNELVDTFDGNVDYDRTTKKTAAEIAIDTKKDKISLSAKAVFASEQNILSTKQDISSKKTNERITVEQALDNRRIKAMSSLGNTYATGMNGGLIPSSAQWNEYYKIARELTRGELEEEYLLEYKGKWSPVDNTDTGPAADDDAKGIGYYWMVDLSNYTSDLPAYELYVEAADVTRWTIDSIEYTIDTHGDVIMSSLLGTPIPVRKTDKPGQLSSIALDGINYWRHGDIVYVHPIYDNTKSDRIDTDGDIDDDPLTEPTGDMVPKTLISKAYRRIANMSAGTSAADN